MARLGVLTSGGDAPGMNTAIRAIVKLCAARGVDVLGVEQGFEGLMGGRMRPLTPRDVDTVSSLGGTVLSSATAR